VARILDLVENASSKKAPTEKFITKFARYYTPAVVLGAVLLAILPPILLPGATFAEWLNRALVFLVVSCPCALVISIPLSFFGGIGRASRSGILVKGSNYLEALNSVRTMVFDKTGTLTEGVFEVTRVCPREEMTKDELLEMAALVESYSSHPIATSIIESYGRELDKSEIREYQEIPGHGVKAIVHGRNIIAGSSRLMEKENIPFEQVQEIGTMVYISIDRQYAGYIVIADKVRLDTPLALQGLRKAGIQKIIMLTGDNQEMGERIGQELGFDEVYAELLPDQKVLILEELEKQKEPGTKLAFIGDGINDAPVLARADIGIAMGGLGSDAAIEAADIVLMTDEPSKILSAVKIAQRTRNIVWQNIIFALGIKAGVLLMGALGVATMWEAVFADVGVALIAILNAMRVLKFDNSLKIQR
jgi:Cd2+/Zn2+-exporting ATPase